MVGVIIYFFLGLIELLLGLRFVFLLLGANPSSAFVAWIYSWSGIFTAPFAGIFGQAPTTAGPGVVAQSVFDWTTLVALIVYGLLGALIGSLFNRWWRPVSY
jgi:YggT family protein